MHVAVVCHLRDVARPVPRGLDAVRIGEDRGFLAGGDCQDLRPGGFGVMMARQLVDELVYGEKGNEVLLVKYLAGHTPGDCS